MRGRGGQKTIPQRSRSREPTLQRESLERALHELEVDDLSLDALYNAPREILLWVETVCLARG